MSKQKFEKISSGIVKQKGVQALADRPNSTAKMGTGGLSASQLKAWFDRLADEVIKNLQKTQDAIAGTDGARYVGMPKMLDIEADNLGDFLEALASAVADGGLSQKLFVTYGTQTVSLQDALLSAAQSISKNTEGLSKTNKDFEAYKSNAAAAEDGQNKMLLGLSNDVANVAQEVDNGKMYAFSAHFSEEADRARGYIKGGAIDRELRAIKSRVEKLEEV